MHGMMGNVPTPIVAMTMYAQNVMETIGSPIAGSSDRQEVSTSRDSKRDRKGGDP